MTWEETDDEIGLLRASSRDHQHQKGYYCEEDDVGQPVMTAAVVEDGARADGVTTAMTRLEVVKTEVWHSQG